MQALKSWERAGKQKNLDTIASTYDVNYPFHFATCAMPYYISLFETARDK